MTTAERLEVLRRRLYRDHATTKDLRRYEEARGAVASRSDTPIVPPAPPTAASAPAIPAPPPAMPPQRAAPRRRRRRVLVAALACGICLAAAAGGFLAGTAEPGPGGAHIQHRTQDVAATIVADIGNGETLTTPRNTAPEPAITRTRIDGEAATSERFRGVGNGVVPLALPTSSFDGGRVRVGLSANHASPMVWRVLRLAARSNMTSYRQIIARGVVTVSTGAARPTTFSYRGLPPMWVVVEASSDQRWILLVALTERGGPKS